MSSARNDWLHGEPTIDEMLSDPVVVAVMKRYGVIPEELRGLLTRRARTYKRRATRKRSRDGHAR
jgi:hypothetical protein